MILAAKQLVTNIEKWEIFTAPNFCENPVAPPEEIFAVLIFVLSASY